MKTRRQLLQLNQQALGAIGGKGVISVLSNILPQQVASLCAVINAGDLTGARELHGSMLLRIKIMRGEALSLRGRLLLGGAARGGEGKRESEEQNQRSERLHDGEVITAMSAPGSDPPARKPDDRPRDLCTPRRIPAPSRWPGTPRPPIAS